MIVDRGCLGDDDYKKWSGLLFCLGGARYGPYSQEYAGWPPNQDWGHLLSKLYRTSDVLYPWSWAKAVSYLLPCNSKSWVSISIVQNVQRSFLQTLKGAHLISVCFDARAWDWLYPETDSVCFVPCIGAIWGALCGPNSNDTSCRCAISPELWDR